MKKREIGFLLTELNPEDLQDPEILEMINQCYTAANQAHAPYSQFQVGALADLGGGHWIMGNNQENIAYPSGLCAERVAIFAARANHPGKAVRRLVLTALDKQVQLDEPVYPCGACRQVLADVERIQQEPIEIWMIGRRRIHKVDRASDLLPLEFTWTGPH